MQSGRESCVCVDESDTLRPNVIQLSPKPLLLIDCIPPFVSIVA